MANRASRNKVPQKKITPVAKPGSSIKDVFTRPSLLVSSIILLSIIFFVFTFFTGGLNNFLLDRHKFIGENAAPVAAGRTKAQSLIQQYVDDISNAGIPVLNKSRAIGSDVCDRESHSFMSNLSLSDFSFSCTTDQHIFIATSYDAPSVSDALLNLKKYYSNKATCNGEDCPTFTLIHNDYTAVKNGPILFDTRGISILAESSSHFKYVAALNLSSDVSGIWISCKIPLGLAACRELGGHDTYKQFLESLPADTKSVIDISGDLTYYVQQ